MSSTFKTLQADNSKPKPEQSDKESDMNGTEKRETYNQNNITAKDETSASYQEIIKYFRYGLKELIALGILPLDLL